MARYLVAADADQIQNLLFRSSHLREVIGGSMLLSKFCDEGTKNVIDEIEEDSKAGIIINDGGSFRLEFNSFEKAKIFLERLADLFRERTGGTLTVAGPIEYEDGEFRAKNEQLQFELHNAKYCREGAEAEMQLPCSAFCTSCGIALANRYDRPFAEKSEEEKTYLCNNCYEKADESLLDKPFFYDEYRKAITAAHPNQSLARLMNPKDAADLIGSLDATQYVGYVLADVNGMGKRFNQCQSPEELSKLSHDLTSALWATLAAPIPQLIALLEERKRIDKLKNRMPIVPLILGGDDVLALVPARYALAIGCKLGEEFEKKMGGVTIAVAVIICQKHYPYTLAYERGHELLKQTKKLSKSFENRSLSALSFEVILGNELKVSTEKKAGDKKEYRSSLKPYWIGSKATEQDSHIAVHFDTLLTQRLALKDIPQKRLHELRRFFDTERVSKLENEVELQDWRKDLEDFLQRLKPKRLVDAVKETLIALGYEGEIPFRGITRASQRYAAHGMLDLIEAWDYAYKLDVKDKEYRPEES